MDAAPEKQYQCPWWTFLAVEESELMDCSLDGDRWWLAIIRNIGSWIDVNWQYNDFYCSMIFVFVTLCNLEFCAATAVGKNSWKPEKLQS